MEEGNRLIQFYYDGIFEEILDQLGQMPLPPYITHQLQDKNRYQTVYAKYDGSAAAPTAGTPFYTGIIKKSKGNGCGDRRGDTSCRAWYIPPGQGDGCIKTPYAFGILPDRDSPRQIRSTMQKRPDIVSLR